MKTKVSTDPLVKNPAPEVRQFVQERYGQHVERILAECKDPGFLNPILWVDIKAGEIICNRLQDFLHGRITSVSHPESSSLTEQYKKEYPAEKNKPVGVNVADRGWKIA
jgi:hypothetical protein